jgi:polyisoprenoid-binding protein YceI
VATSAEASPALQDQLTNGSLAGQWILDPTRSTAVLRSKSMWGVLPVKGIFRDIEGTGTVTPDGNVTGMLAVKSASVDTKIRKRDEHLRSADFFSSDKYPLITFALEKAEPDSTSIMVSGTLTVRDRSRQLSFPATVGHTPDGELSLDAAVQIDRADFGMTFNQMMNMISTQNTITLHAVFTKG